MSVAPSPRVAADPREAGMWPAWLAVIACAGLVLAVVLLIDIRPAISPVWDQSFIGYELTGGYPHFDTGIVSYLIVGAINLLIPYDGESSNTLVRALAGASYIASGALLGWSITGPRRLQYYLAFMLLLVSTRFPFLWLSSELFAATLMMLFLWSLVRGHSHVVTAVFLVLFSLSKADLALPGLLVGVWLVARPGSVPRWLRAAVLAGLAAAFVVPGLLFASSHYAQFGGRTWVSFGQHYGELVRWLQVEPSPPGWTSARLYRESGFPGASSVLQAALMHPRQYAYFVSLSAAESAIRLIPTKLLLLIPAAIYFFRGLSNSQRAPVLLLLSSIIPIVFLSFLHVRYQARFYPLVLFIIFAGLRGEAFGPRHVRALAVLLGVVLLWQLVDLVPVLQTAHWLPD